MTSYSQAGQDIFVRLIYGPDFKGTFLDIGCAGDQYSNTLALEQEGWTGTLIDQDSKAAKGRTSRFICTDAVRFTFKLPEYINYLSLDVDENSLDALRNLPLNTTRFGIITIEHDAYRFGDRLRPFERDILISHSYLPVCMDVCGATGAPFEDWWIDGDSQGLILAASRFTCRDKLYSDIIKLL
jgi:hypothetical protein